MKNFLKIALVLTLLSTSFAVYGNDDFLLKVNEHNKKSIVFFINEVQDVNLTIYAPDGEVVYEQKIHSPGAAKKVYNLNSFPNGQYTLALETPLKQTIYQVTIEGGEAIISNPIVKERFKPVLVKEKDTITLSFGDGVKGAVSVTVLNESSDELYKSASVKPTDVQKFNIRYTNAKELTFVVSYKGEEHIETFKLR